MSVIFGLDVCYDDTRLSCAMTHRKAAARCVVNCARLERVNKDAPYRHITYRNTIVSTRR